MSGRQQIDRYSSLSALHKLQLTPSLSKLYMVGYAREIGMQHLLCKAHRPEADRFSVVCIQIFALPVRSHLAGFFKA